jgi:release factor glutamine methyltransferase
MELPREFIAAAARLLKSGGFVAIEHHESQGSEIALAMEREFSEVALHNDLAGRPRFTTAIRR